MGIVCVSSCRCCVFVSVSYIIEHNKVIQSAGMYELGAL